jgi:predicted nucleic acid-binding protein
LADVFVDTLFVIALVNKNDQYHSLALDLADPPLFRKAFDLYKSHSDKLWGLIDCVSFVVMNELAIPGCAQR